MPTLSEHDVFIFVAQLGVILISAKIFGEIARKLEQPIIVGEVIAGILLGPMLFGKFLPTYYNFLFPNTGAHQYLLQGISWLCVLFLLMITGLEIDFRASIKEGKQCFLISIFGLVISLGGVFLVTPLLPDYFYPDGVNRFHVNMLISIALSVVAIPVIAKILFDLKILRSEVGVKILTSGVLSDIWGWTILAIAISLIASGTITAAVILKPLITMILYLTVTLTIGRVIIDKMLDLFGYKELDTTLAISLLFSLMLLNGAVAHLLGIHVIFGAFIAGVMAGESTKISEYIRQWTQEFIFAVFAPIFFVLIGMQLQFTKGEIWLPILILFIASSICKIAGMFFGGVLGKMGRKNAFAVACGLNTQGTMGIIVALIAYDMGIFNDHLFSTIVVICILTSLFVGPLLKWAIARVKRPLAKFFDQEHVFLNVEGDSKKKVIENIAKLMAERKIIDNEEYIQKMIWERERVMSTAIGDGIAVPHARIKNLKEPILCFFRLKDPVDFASPDNLPVQLLFLELTDRNDDGMQLNLIAQIARFISAADNRQRLLDCEKEEDIHHILSFDEKV